MILTPTLPPLARLKMLAAELPSLEMQGALASAFWSLMNYWIFILLQSSKLGNIVWP